MQIHGYICTFVFIYMRLPQWLSGKEPACNAGATGDISLIPGLGRSPGGGNSYPSQVALVVKDPPANAGDARDADLVPGSGRSPGGGNGNPLQYSCLKNPMDRGAWRATAHGVTKTRTRLKRLILHA